MSLDVQVRQAELEPTVLDSEPVSTTWGPRAAFLYADGDAGEKKEAQPVSAGERFFAVDVLRGFALLGILAMNIVGFGWPMAAYENPLRGGGFRRARPRTLVLQPHGFRSQDDDHLLHALWCGLGLDGSASRCAWSQDSPRVLSPHPVAARDRSNSLILDLGR